MRNLTIYVAIIIGICLMSCQDQNANTNLKNKAETNVYLVRHAEKGDDGTRDPALTIEGIERAERLATFLSDANINHVYSTDYKRTKSTAEPTARANGYEVKIYDPRDLEGVSNLIDSLKGQNILIVGHSNSTPTLTNLMLGEDLYEQIDESDYSNLFVITKIGKHKYSKHLHL